eukprot:13737615-Alexandrium_andersonii.AAC.1
MPPMLPFGQGGPLAELLARQSSQATCCPLWASRCNRTAGALQNAGTNLGTRLPSLITRKHDESNVHK